MPNSRNHKNQVRGGYMYNTPTEKAAYHRKRVADKMMTKQALPNDNGVRKEVNERLMDYHEKEAEYNENQK